ncbi:hypothetical protein D3C72_1760470 [compost metagenome]
MLQRFAVAIDQINPQWQLGIFVHPDYIAIARAITRNHADHFAGTIGNTGAANGDEIVIFRQAAEIGINNRRQRIDDMIAGQRKGFQTGFEIADPAAAL